MFTEKQVKKLKLHSKEAVEWLEDNCPDCPWLQYLGSLDFLCDTTITLFQSQRKEITMKTKKVKERRKNENNKR